MEKFKQKRIKMQFYGFLICILTLAFQTSSFALDISPWGVNIQQSNTAIALPFSLPEKLYEGAYAKYPNASGMREFEYSGAGKVIVYFYSTPESALNDIGSFAKRNVVVSKEESNFIASHSGFFQDNEKEQAVTLWFALENFIIGIQGPKNLAGNAQLLKAGENIIAVYNERTTRLFSTPEKCLETYLKAVDEQDSYGILECLYSDGSEKAQEMLRARKTILSYQGFLFLMEGFNSKKSGNIVTAGKAEMVSDTYALLPVKGQFRSSASQLLLMNVGLLDENTTIQLPFKKVNAKWKFDLVTLQGLAERTKAKTGCLQNLKQIGLALHMYAQDHQEKFPDSNTFTALVPKYVTARMFKCPSDESTPEIIRIGQPLPPPPPQAKGGKSTPEIQGQPEAGTKISYIFVEGLSQQDPLDTIVAYDASAENHKGEGRNVLFLDGRVSWMSEKEFQDLLSKKKR